MNPQGQLYRALYLKDGWPKGQTFWADDILEAHKRADFIEKTTKCPVLTLKALGGSIFNPPKHKAIIVKQRMLKEGIWPTRTVFITIKRGESE